MRLATYTLADNVENLYLADVDSVFLGYGNGLNNHIEGNQYNNYLSGWSGNDEIYGHEGNDTLHGGEGNDVLLGEDGNDWIDGGSGDDRLFGEKGDDLLAGGIGSDILVGGDGKDFLSGRSSGLDDIFNLNNQTGEKDTLTGGADADTFYLGSFGKDYWSYMDYGYSNITDFKKIEGDRLNVLFIEGGNESDFSLDQTKSLGGSYAKDTQVLYKGDLVAVLQDTTAVSIQSHFDFLVN